MNISEKSEIKLIFSIDVILASLCLLVPMLTYLGVVLRGLTFTWVVFFIWLISILIKQKSLGPFGKMLLSRAYEFTLLFAFVLIILFNYLFVNTSAKGLQYILIFATFFLVLVIDSYYVVRPIVYKQTIFFLIVIALGIQAAISIPYVLSNNPLTIRLLSSGGLDKKSMLDALKHGVGSNALYTSSAAILFLGLAAAKYFSFFPRLALYISLLAIFISVLLSTFLTSIMMIVVGLLVIAVLNYRKLLKIKVLFGVVSLIACFLVLFTMFFENNLLFQPVQEKFSRLMAADGDVTGRDAHAQTSFHTFLEHPVLGVGVPEWGSYEIIGEHMPWLDFFAHFGILGFTPLLLFLLLIFFKSFPFYFRNDEHQFYRRMCFVGFVIFLISNLFGPMLTVPNFYMMLILFYSTIETTYFKVSSQRLSY